MSTQHNIFVRKFGKLAVIMTVTDWEDFKELGEHSKHEDPDFILSGVTDKNIYTNMNPSMIISTRGEVKDITEETRGKGLASILTSPFWSYRKLSGLSAISEMITPKL